MKVTRRKFCEQAMATSVMAGLEMPSFAGDKVIDNCETNMLATSTPSMAKSIIGDFRFIDLFCGIGGFHQAMSDLGGKCVFACDIDADCRKTYQRNYQFLRLKQFNVASRLCVLGEDKDKFYAG